MQYAFIAEKVKLDQEIKWEAKSLYFIGCSCIGDTLSDAVRRLEEEEMRRIEDRD